MVAGGQDAARHEAAPRIDRHGLAHHGDGAARRRARARGGNEPAAERDVADAGAVLALARRDHGARGLVRLEGAGGPCEVERIGLVEAARGVVDAQDIGEFAGPLRGHLPGDLPVRGGRQDGDDRAPPPVRVDDPDLGAVDEDRVVGRGAERHDLARAVGRAQVRGADVEEAPPVEPVEAHVDLGRVGCDVGRTARIGRGRRAGDRLAVDRDREARRAEPGARKRVDEFGIVAGRHRHDDIGVLAGATGGLGNERLVAAGLRGGGLRGKDKGERGRGAGGVGHGHHAAPLTRPTARWSARW